MRRLLTPVMIIIYDLYVPCFRCAQVRCSQYRINFSLCSIVLEVRGVEVGSSQGSCMAHYLLPSNCCCFALQWILRTVDTTCSCKAQMDSCIPPRVLIPNYPTWASLQLLVMGGVVAVHVVVFRYTSCCSKPAIPYQPFCVPSSCACLLVWCFTTDSASY